MHTTNDKATITFWNKLVGEIRSRGSGPIELRTANGPIVGRLKVDQLPQLLPVDGSFCRAPVIHVIVSPHETQIVNFSTILGIAPPPRPDPVGPRDRDRPATSVAAEPETPAVIEDDEDDDNDDAGDRPSQMRERAA